MSKLFTPLKSGILNLGHRIALAPLTRFRADDDGVPLPMVREYYAQRASTPGTLLVTEGTVISVRAAGGRNVPGIYTEAQVAGWKKVVDAVHAKGSQIFCQLWHLGRAGDTAYLAPYGLRIQSCSPAPIDPSREVPEEMTEDDIQQTVSDYAAAARNAIRAGFDGVEIHGANGYLLDQFLQDVCNQRTDRWGGSIENRARLHLTVAEAIVGAVGADRVGMRLSPHSTFQGMLMADPMPTFKYLVRGLRAMGLAYLHLVEERVSGPDDTEVRVASSNTPLVEIWDNLSPVLLAGGFSPESAKEAVDVTDKNYDIVIVFGRHFIANPDLVFRIKNGIALNKYDRSTFYTPKSEKGYIDYPFSREFLQQAGA